MNGSDGDHSNNAQANERQIKSSHRGPLVVGAVILMAAVVYLSSVGPMYWLCSNSSNELVGLPGKAFLLIYDPVLWQYQNGSPRIRSVVRGYVDFFEK